MILTPYDCSTVGDELHQMKIKTLLPEIDSAAEDYVDLVQLR